MLTSNTGNCLFHALSDQMYGDQGQHAKLRADTVEYMREHPEDFKAFVIANPGGGIRRNPKRKNAGALTQPFDPAPPSEADISTAFALSLDIMAKGGTYGDNAEIIAFSSKFHVDIRIWSASIGRFLCIDCGAAPGEQIQTLYIVHHVSAPHGEACSTILLIDFIDLRTLLLRPQHRWPFYWHAPNQHPIYFPRSQTATTEGPCRRPTNPEMDDRPGYGFSSIRLQSCHRRKDAQAMPRQHQPRRRPAAPRKLVLQRSELEHGAGARQ